MVWRRTFQSIRLFKNLTVFENVHAAVLASGSAASAKLARDRVRELLKEFALEDRSDAMALSLSHGSQRRLGDCPGAGHQPAASTPRRTGGRHERGRVRCAVASPVGLAPP